MDRALLANCVAELHSLRARLAVEVQRGEESIVEAAQVAGDPTHLPTHAADYDSGAVESNVATTEQQAETLAAVAEALQRVADGTFGRCQLCGGNIAPLRLEAIPYTPYCFGCAAKLEGE